MTLLYRLGHLLAVMFLLGIVGLGITTSYTPRSSPAAPASSNLLYNWGDNTHGQLADGSTTQQNSPEIVHLGVGVRPTTIAGGLYHSLAIGSDGQLYGWGYDLFGQLGDGSTTDKSSPVVVNFPAGVRPITIAAGYQHGLAIGNDGQLYGWGRNVHGEVGVGNYAQQNNPVVVNLAAGVRPTAIAAGEFHSLAIGSDGKLYAWGWNQYGQLGNGSTTDKPSPTLVNLGITPIALAVGADHNLVIGSDDKLYTWGWNQFGQLGDNSTLDKSIPAVVNLPAGVTPTVIAAGGIHSFTIGSNGKLYAWGGNAYGQLGNGSTAQLNTPGLVNVPAGVTITSVVGGLQHSLAIGSDGKLYAWGGNAYGQLGDGTTTQRNSPVAINVVAGANTTAIAAGGYHSLVIQTPPVLSINNITHNEGNSGPTTFTFTVSLSYATSQTVTVQYATADNTATTADNDYVPVAGTLTIPPGQISGTITALVNGDTKVERDETFAINLTNPVGAASGSPATGIGTILNDDTAVASCNPLVVTSNGDDGSCGTLRYAVLHAAQPPLNSKPKTVRIDLAAGSVILLTSGLVLPDEVSITTTASCGIESGNTMLPPIILQGIGAGSGNGLTLSGHNQLYGLWVRGFSGVQIKAPPGSSTKMQCVRVSKG